MKSFSKLFLVLSFALLICSLPLSAQTPPAAGYDLLQTGSGASIDLSSVGLGNVSLQGVPIATTTGTSDTIMQRPQPIVFGPGNPVQVTAIFMKSVNSTTFMGQPVDVYVTLNNSNGNIPTTVLPQPDTNLTPSSGSLNVSSNGTFSSSLTVNADVIFVKAGMPVTNSANYVAHQAASPITLTSSASTWTSTPPAGYPSSTTYPSGGFYPRPVHSGPHPVIPSTCAPAPKQPVQQKVNSTDTKSGSQAPAPALTNQSQVVACVSSIQTTQ
jgi:hypothetical protein